MSNNLGRREVAANQNQKEVVINDSDGILDAALTEIYEANLSSGDVTLELQQLQQTLVIRVSNLSKSGRKIIVPASKKFFAVESQSGNTKDFSLQVGTKTVNISPGTVQMFYMDGEPSNISPVGGGGAGGGVGVSGPPGPKGDKGDTGPQGPKGDKGDTGPQGAAGSAGTASFTVLPEPQKYIYENNKIYRGWENVDGKHWIRRWDETTLELKKTSGASSQSFDNFWNNRAGLSYS